MNVLIVKTDNNEITFKLFQNNDFILGGIFSSDNSKYYFEDIGVNKKLQIQEDEYFDAVEYIKEWIKSEGALDRIVFKVNHGFDKFSLPVVISSSNIKDFREISEIKSLGNKLFFNVLQDFQKIFPNTVQVGVFDTEIFSSMPLSSYVCPLPSEYIRDYSIRKYGSHGIVHEWMMQATADYLTTNSHPNPAFDRSDVYSDVKMITVWVDKEISLTASKNGIVIDTSSGFGTMDQLLHSTSVQKLDIGVLEYLTKTLGYTVEQVLETCMHNSGMENLDEKVDSMEFFKHHLMGEIGRLVAVLNGVESITFGGKLSSSPKFREDICENLSNIGIQVDKSVNFEIQPDTNILEFGKGLIRLFAVNANEDLAILNKVNELKLN